MESNGQLTMLRASAAESSQSTIENFQRANQMTVFEPRVQFLKLYREKSIKIWNILTQGSSKIGGIFKKSRT